MVTALKRQRKSFDFTAKRRREIVLHARHVGAMDTEDRSRWLVAWVWHNRKAKDQIWSVMEAAKRMGGKITEAEASSVTEEASICRKHLTADNLARFLGVTYAQRQHLRLTPSAASTSRSAPARNYASGLPTAQGTNAPRPRNAPAIVISIRNPTMEANRNEPQNLGTAPEQGP